MQSLKAAVAGRRISVVRSNPWTVQERSAHRLFGKREIELLAEDPALAPFKSSKPTAKKMSMVGDAIIVVLGVGFLYETYYRWQKKWNEVEK